MENSKIKLSKKEERLNNLEGEEFFLIFFKGSLMPNYTKYDRITMFKDIFYIENEVKAKEYVDMFFILKVKELIKNNISKIEGMDKRKNEKVEYPKSSFANIMNIKIDNKTFSVDRSLLNDEEQKEYDNLVKEIYGILGIESNRNSKLIKLINEWRDKKDSDSFCKVIRQIKETSFYCPTKASNDGKKMIATIKNSKGDTLLLAFSNKEEAQKWNEDLTINYIIYNFDQYAEMLLSDTNTNIGFVIDPFGANLTLDKKIITDIKKFEII